MSGWYSHRDRHHHRLVDRHLLVIFRLLAARHRQFLSAHADWLFLYRLLFLEAITGLSHIGSCTFNMKVLAVSSASGLLDLPPAPLCNTAGWLSSFRLHAEASALHPGLRPSCISTTRYYVLALLTEGSLVLE
jgi:hypothetical protein